MPGTLVYEGDAPAGPVLLRVFDYDATRVEERTLHDVAAWERRPATDAATVTWIDMEGVHDVALIRAVGQTFGLHPLTLEDIASPDQRPKIEEYPDYVYLVLKMMHYDHRTGSVEPEQVSIVVGRGFLLSFQEAKAGDPFEPVRHRLRGGHGYVRSAGADYLAYALVDVIVDHYLDILEGLGEHIERLEDDLLDRPTPGVLRAINRLRRQVFLLRRSIWPLRDVIVAFERSDCSFITADVDPYLRDVYDHTVRTVELIESAREMLAALTELYLATASHRMNEVIKVLTVIATFFLPLSFIAGVYGMNFDPAASPLNMPELGWAWGYPFAWALMLATAGGLLLFFRRRGWI